MWGNSNSNNFFIWLILLILIFFRNGSLSPISQSDYFKITSPNEMLLNGFI